MTYLSIKIAIVIVVTTISSSVAKTLDSASTPSYPNNVAFLPRRDWPTYSVAYSSNNNLLDDNEDIIKCSTTTHQSKTLTQATDDDDHDEHLSRHPLLRSESAVRAAVHRANRKPSKPSGSSLSSRIVNILIR